MKSSFGYSSQHNQGRREHRQTWEELPMRAQRALATDSQLAQPQHPKKAGAAAYSERDRQRTEPRLRCHLSLSLLLRLWWFLNLCRRICVSELCALVPRIRYRYAKNLDSCGVPLGTRYHALPTGPLVLNTHAQVRIRDMQSWLSSFPAATLVDLQVFLEGWDRGAESHSAEFGSGCKEPMDRTLS